MLNCLENAGSAPLAPGVISVTGSVVGAVTGSSVRRVAAWLRELLCYLSGLSVAIAEASNERENARCRLLQGSCCVCGEPGQGGPGLVLVLLLRLGAEEGGDGCPQQRVPGRLGMPRPRGAPEGCPVPAHGALLPARCGTAWHGTAALGARVLALLRVLLPTLPSSLPEN